MSPDITVFYAGMLYGEFNKDSPVRLHELPDGVYIHVKRDTMLKGWYLKDLTPVLLADVPKELLTYLLILT